jgi:hypothetical protein
MANPDHDRLAAILAALEALQARPRARVEGFAGELQRALGDA